MVRKPIDPTLTAANGIRSQGHAETAEVARKVGRVLDTQLPRVPPSAPESLRGADVTLDAAGRQDWDGPHHSASPHPLLGWRWRWRFGCLLAWLRMRAWLAVALSLSLMACDRASKDGEVDSGRRGSETMDASPRSTVSAADVIADAQGAIEYRDCGCVGRAPACEADGAIASDAVSCFVDGLDDCDRVVLAHREYSTEGDLIVTTYVSTPTPAGCKVIVIDDSTNDRFGNCRLARHECASLSVADGDGSLAEEDCSAFETLREGC